MRKKTNNNNKSINLLCSTMSVLVKHRLFLGVFALLMISSLGGIAQPPPPGGTGPPCWPPPCVPIDGGISFLLAAGLAYGAKKTIDFKKSNEENTI